jgi:hypothetical protein
MKTTAYAGAPACIHHLTRPATRGYPNATDDEPMKETKPPLVVRRDECDINLSFAAGESDVGCVRPERAVHWPGK